MVRYRVQGMNGILCWENGIMRRHMPVYYSLRDILKGAIEGIVCLGLGRKRLSMQIIGETVQVSSVWSIRLL